MAISERKAEIRRGRTELDIVGAESADAHQIAEIHIRTSRLAYRGLISDARLAAFDVSTRTSEWQQWLANPTADVFVARSTRIIGFCNLIASRDSDLPDDSGEIAAIYVDPTWQRRGVGGLLIETTVARAKERGFRLLTLWTLRENSRARKFYEAKGFTRDGSERFYPRAPGARVRDIRYRLSL